MKFYASFQITAQNCLINRAISYGDGVFETMLICKHDIPLWAFHYQRLEASMIRLQIHPLVEHEIHHKIMSLIADDKLYIVKLVVFRDDVKRGYASASNDAKYFITVNPYQKAVVQDKLTISRVKLSRQKKLAGLKHLNRLEQVLAAQELTGGHYNDALMLDKDNIIIETISKNIILIKGEQLYTPKLNKCGVYGVALRWLQAQGFKLNWKKIEFKSLAQYHGFMVCNSIQGFNEIKSIDERFQFKCNHAIVEKIKLKWQRQVNT
ncbi:MAG: aminodeoxychorismate lyase [Alcanivoracaceae bacterium]|nr:aminodeoxychorismate lyase [Alcanivoracaceae bacterium]